jgi:hypothetical protein
LAVLIAGVGALFVLARRRKSDARAAWNEAAGRAVTDARLVVDGCTSTFASNGGREPALQSHLQAVSGALASLQTSAPSTEAGQSVAAAQGAAGDLSAALAADVSLRIGPPAPTEDQLATSNMVIGQRARDLEATLGPLTQAASSD